MDIDTIPILQLNIGRNNSHTSIPIDTCRAYNVDAAHASAQSQVYDTDDPGHVCHGNGALLASNTQVRNIPINALHNTYLDDRDIRGHIDTGARVSCSNALHLFHQYRSYDDIFKSPIRLSAAINKRDKDTNASIISQKVKDSSSFLP